MTDHAIDRQVGTVLVVDDNASGRFVKSQILRRAGFVVIEAQTGLSALELARKHAIDAVLLDVNLPDISGIEVCGRIKADGSLAGVAVVQVSATATTDDDKVRGLRGGADAYLTDTGDPQVLVATVQSLLRTRRAEQHRAETDRHAREVAEDANEAKDDFLATLSHELRTPLNAMLGWISMLKTDDGDVERRRRAIEALDRSARLQWRLVNELLDMASIRQRKIRLELAALDLETLTGPVLDVVRSAAAAKNIEVIVNTVPAVVQGDAARLSQVLTNLMNNAIQFTPPGGAVSLAVRSEGEMAVLEVRDTGSGIDPAFLPYIFEEFRQDSANRNVHGGLGLGLAIARHIVELHDGMITARSDGIGRGATLTVRIPRTHPAPASRIA